MYKTLMSINNYNIVAAAASCIMFMKVTKCKIYFDLCSTQIPHAVGAGYSLKMDKKDACAVTYFGDGGSSEVNYKISITADSFLPFLKREILWDSNTP